MKIETKKKTEPLEKTTQAKIKKYLISRGASVDIITKGLYGGNGIADIIGVYKGAYIALEVKRLKGIVSPIQSVWLAEKGKHGAFCAVVRSVEEAEAFINDIDHVLDVKNYHLE